MLPAWLGPAVIAVVVLSTVAIAAQVYNHYTEDNEKQFENDFNKTKEQRERKRDSYKPTTNDANDAPTAEETWA